MKYIFVKNITTVIILLVTGAFVAAGQSNVTKRDLKKLAATMAGDYNNSEQAAKDSAFFEITLRMLPIWKKETDGYWFYVEQSLASMQEKPYRQRVYNVYIVDDSTIVSKVYEISNPIQYAGGWKNPSLLTGLTRDSLIDREGCGVYLHKTSEGFSGSTPGKQCLSSFKQATYATSEVTITHEKILSWDRGWNASDKQVWGSVSGGYVFNKKKKLK